jgi:hypothetical protein
MEEFALSGRDFRLCGDGDGIADHRSIGSVRTCSHTGVIMQSFTFGFGNWLRHLAAQSPLVRVVDRIEAGALLLIITVALVAAPIAGAIGTATHEKLARQYAVDRASRHTVTATATEDSNLVPQPYEEPFLTQIRWQAAGIEHTEEVRTYRMRTGDTMTIWVDTNGNPTHRPLTEGNAATEAVVTGFGLWFAAVGVAGAAWTLLRLRLNRARSAFWDRELAHLADNDGRTNRNA